MAIETSCDETSVAIVRGAPFGTNGSTGTEVLSNVVSSQIDLHAGFGGVVPEVASRAHLEVLESVIASAIDKAGVKSEDIDGVAATHGPGLIGALLIGVSAAKAMALAWDVPYVGVNHMEGHLFATFLEKPDVALPVVVLLVSGGHTMIVEVRRPGTYRYLGSTIDDAAGEAFDKVARYLGLGYPGGPIIDKLANQGNRNAIKFPRALQGREENNTKGGRFDFSFSGVKTAVVNYVRRHPDVSNEDVAASFQEAVVDVLVEKTIAAAIKVGAATVCIGGGVAANSRLRERISDAAADAGLECLIPSTEYCTDNAAMIAAAGLWRLEHDGPSAMDAGAEPSLKLPTFG